MIHEGTSGYVNPSMSRFATVNINELVLMSDLNVRIFAYGSDKEDARKNLKKSLEYVKAECEKYINELN